MNAVPSHLVVLLAVAALTLACVGCFVAEVSRAARTLAEMEEAGAGRHPVVDASVRHRDASVRGGK